MSDQQPRKARVRFGLLVVYVVFGSIALFGAMLALSFLLIPERGFAVVYGSH